MKWYFPIVLHKDPDSDYGVTVPDLPGCFSAGRTPEEAIAMVQEAIELHLEGLVEDGEPLPSPAGIQQYQDMEDYADGTWAIVPIEPQRLRFSSRRLNITMPERVIESVDRYAKEHGITRSALLAIAATHYIGRGDDPAMQHVKPGSSGVQNTRRAKLVRKKKRSRRTVKSQ